LEREQKRRRKVERKKGEQWGTGSKVKQSEGTKANIAMASSLAKEVGDTSTVGPNRIYSNGRSREDRCSNGAASITRGRV